MMPSGAYDDQSYQVTFTSTENCSPPSTAVAIFKGVTLRLPANDSYDSDTTGIVLEWKPSQYFDTYHLQVSTDSTLSSLLIDTTITPSQFTLPTLQSHVSYYWRVSGNNVEGESRWSPVWRFTTEADPAGVAIQTSSDITFTCTPNPASNMLNITLPAPARVVLYDLHGNIVRSVTTSEPTLRIETGDIASGTYIVGVTTPSMHGSQLIQILH